MSHRILPGLLLALVLAPAAPAQNLQYEVAGLREDIRGLVQRVGELNLRVEQLERENAELRRSATSKDFATLVQLNEAIATSKFILSLLSFAFINLFIQYKGNTNSC